MRVAEDVDLSEIVAGPDNEFPDFTAKLNERTISIELTELLHSDGVLKEASKGRVGFEQLQWTEIHFRKRIGERLDAKASKLSAHGKSCDVLLLHADEPWLSPAMVEQWLSRGTFEPRAEFGAVYLLMTYVPGWAEHWPIFRLDRLRP